MLISLLSITNFSFGADKIRVLVFTGGHGFKSVYKSKTEFKVRKNHSADGDGSGNNKYPNMFFGGFDFEKELKQQLDTHKLIVEENADYYLIPFQYKEHKLHIYIGDKKNPYWYGFGEKIQYSLLGENITKIDEIINQLHNKDIPFSSAAAFTALATFFSTPPSKAVFFDFKVS